MKPKVAIVGRPNVGKSALFNRILGERVAIVDEMEGVTRDRIERETDAFGVPFTLFDTGGIHTKSKALFNEEVKWQALSAIEEADLIVFVVDSQVGITDLDEQVAKILHHAKKPIILAINKIDSLQHLEKSYPFASLGFSLMVGVSAIHGFQIAELLEEIRNHLPPHSAKESFQGTKVSIVGKPNVGKSSLVNALIDETRCIVSPIPGTTRDSIDIAFTHNSRPYTLIDTAGIRRKKAEKEVVDKFAFIRTQESIERSDICILVLDAQTGLSHQEKKIINIIEEMGKPCLVLLNKWDLVQEVRMEHTLQGLEQEAPFLKHCPKLILSVKTGRNLEKIFPNVENILDFGTLRIGTGELNKFIEQSIQKQHPPMHGGRRLRIYYMTQISTNPPTFVLFINHKELLKKPYEKYLQNQFRKTYQFTGYPIRFVLRQKSYSKK